jgi:hypothetical protein
MSSSTGPGFDVEQVGGGDDDAGRAEAALDARSADHHLLHPV